MARPLDNAGPSWGKALKTIYIGVIIACTLIVAGNLML